MSGFKDLFGGDYYDPEKRRQPITEGERRKEEGIAKVTRRDPWWVKSAVHVLRQIPLGTTATWEEFKAMIVAKIGKPEHVNMWGAVTRAGKKSLIVEVGRADCKSYSAQKRGGGQAIYKRV